VAFDLDKQHNRGGNVWFVLLSKEFLSLLLADFLLFAAAIPGTQSRGPMLSIGAIVAIVAACIAMAVILVIAGFGVYLQYRSTKRSDLSYNYFEEEPSTQVG
jgi:hypothetical protein